MFDSAVRRAGLELSIECPPLPATAFVDREMWAKIVLNLLSNALKATFTGGITVRLGTDEDKQEAVLEVSDTGIGISVAEQQHLFERFHRVAGAALRTHEGSGIGLALVAELAALHGGDVGVESTPGEGSTFRVRVPLGRAHLPVEQVAGQVRADAPGAAQFSTTYLAEATRWVDGHASDGTVPSGVPAAPGARHHGDGLPRVLVVDDTPDMREYVGGLLAEEYVVADRRRRRAGAGDGPPSTRRTWS